MRDSEESTNRMSIGTKVEADYQGEGTYIRGSITRQHRNGNYTIEYEDGTVEKQVPEDRIRIKDSRSKKSRSSSNEDDVNESKFSKGDKVKVKDEDGEWQLAKVSRVHSNGTYTVVYEENNEKESRVKERRIRKAGKSKQDCHSDTENPVFKQNSKVQVKSDNEWRNAAVQNVRQGDLYDVEYQDQDGEVEKRVRASRMRLHLKPLEKDTRVSYEANGETHDGVIKKVRNENSYDILHDSDHETVGKRIDRHSINAKSKWSGAMSSVTANFHRNLELHQRVKFKHGSIQCTGEIVKIRNDGNVMDIKYLSDDEEKVAKRIPRNDIQSISSFSSAATSLSNKLKQVKLPTLSRSLSMNTSVEYDEDGDKHVGKICKIRENGTYDVQHDSDDDHVSKKIKREDIKVIYNSGIGTAMAGKLRDAFTSNIEDGSKVSFLHPKTQVWRDGFVVRVRQDKSYDIEFTDEDDESNICKRVLRSNIKLRTTDAPQNFSEGCVVEVSARRGNNVYIGTILRKNKDGTFKIQYEDGDKENSVDISRLRVSGTKLRIGVEVSLISQDTSRGVTKEKGRIEWIHRNDSVVIRTEREENIFCGVPRKSFTIAGEKPGEGNGVSLTTKSMIQFLVILSLEILFYAYYAFGASIVVSEGFKIHSMTGPDFFQNVDQMNHFYGQGGNWSNECLRNATYFIDESSNSVIIPETVFSLDRHWLIGLMISLAVLLFLLVLLMIYTVFTKVNMLQDSYVDNDELRLETKLRRLIGFIILGMLLISSFTILCYGSLLNKLEYYCLWNSKSMGYSLDTWAFNINPFELRASYPNITHALIGATGKITFKLFSGLLLILIIQSGKTFGRIVVSILPTLLLVTVLLAKTVSTAHIYHLVQKSFVQQGSMNINMTIDLAIILVVFAHWINFIGLKFYWNFVQHEEIENRHEQQGQAGRDTLDMAERGEFGVQAKIESLMERKDALKRKMGPVRLAFLKIYRWLALHVIVVVFSIITDFELLPIVSDNSNWSGSILTDLIMNILWLVLLLTTPLATKIIRTQFPDINKIPGGF